MPDFKLILKIIAISLGVLYFFLLIWEGTSGFIIPLVGAFFILFIWLNGSWEDFLCDLVTFLADFISSLF